MANKKRLTVSLKHQPAFTATRVSIGKDKLVYVLIADKRLDYEDGKSRIAYIGTTRNGASRVARSVAYRAQEILELRGVRSISARIITCKPRQKVETWKKLERALLLQFREMFGEVPWCNTHGKGIKERDEFEKYFTRSRIRSIIEDLS